MSESALAVPEKVEKATSQLLIAANPAQMKMAQGDLEKWFAGKVSDVRGQLSEMETAFEVAERNRWGRSAIKNQISRLRGQMTFYEKALAAVRAGFCLIPDFPIDLFAIRVSPESVPADHDSEWKNQHWAQRSDELPTGAGENVSAIATRHFSHNQTGKDYKGEPRQESVYRDMEFRDIQFPIVALKPEVMNATAEALAMRIFDEVGICPQTRRADPMIIGRIRMRSYGQQQSLSFLICWYMDLRTL